MSFGGHESLAVAVAPERVDGVGGEPDPMKLDLALQSLLSVHPQARISAVREDGVFVPMPESLAVGHSVLSGLSALSLVLPEDRAAVMTAWDQALAAGAARCPARLRIDAEHAGTFYAFDVRPVHGVLVVVFTPSAHAASSAGDDRSIFDVVPKVARVCKDERSVLLKVDEALTQILGWGADEMKGRRSMEFVHPEDHAIAIENWMEMLAAPGPGRRVRLRHRHRDGGWVWFEITNHNLLDDPEHGCVVTGMVDISDEMAAHEALRAREQLLDRLAEAVPVGLVQIDAVRRVVYTNDRLHQIVGIERSETLQQQLSSVVETDQPALGHAIDNVLGIGSPTDIEVELRLPDRDLRRCAVSLRALSDEADRINGAIACVTDVTDSARMREELRRRATIDELTGCYNRASTMRALDEQIARNGSGATPGVIFIDLDHFKQVNDQFGHACGDKLLRIAAQRITAGVRAHDIVGRIGGDEFLVVLPDVESPRYALQLAQRLAVALQNDMCLGGATVSNTASIGVACANESHTDAEMLVAEADSAMYQSKRQRAAIPTSQHPGWQLEATLAAQSHLP